MEALLNNYMSKDVAGLVLEYTFAYKNKTKKQLEAEAKPRVMDISRKGDAMYEIEPKFSCCDSIPYPVYVPGSNDNLRRMQEYMDACERRQALFHSIVQALCA